VLAVIEGLQSGTGFTNVPGMNATIEAAALDASHWAYAHAYRLAWASIIPFIVLALVSVIFLQGVKELMTEKVEATVEHIKKDDGVKA